MIRPLSYWYTTNHAAKLQIDSRNSPGPLARPGQAVRAAGRSRGCGLRETPGGGGAGSLISALQPEHIWIAWIGRSPRGGPQGALFGMLGTLLPSASRLKRSSRPGNDLQKLAGSHRLEPAGSPSPHRPAPDRRRRAGGDSARSGILPWREARTAWSSCSQGVCGRFPRAPRRDDTDRCTVDGGDNTHTRQR